MKIHSVLLRVLLLSIAMAVVGLAGVFIFDQIRTRGLIRDLDHTKHRLKTEISQSAGKAELRDLDPRKLAAISEELAALKTKAFLVVRGDTIVHEFYAHDFGPDKKHYTASLAKALVGGVALSVLLDDKAITLDEPVSTYLTSWKADPGRSKITVRHLATHTSGLEDSRHGDKKKQADTDDWKNIYWDDHAARFQLAMTKASIIREPGSEVLYSNPGYAILSYVVTASLSESDPSDIYNLLLQRIMRPLAIPDKAWKISYGKSYDVYGLKVYAMGGGAKYTARAIAGIGQLMLQKGSWEGRQLISPEAVTTATSSAAPHGALCPPDHPMPGLGWWTNANGAWPSLPRDAFAGAGRNHEILLVIPSLNLVVVRLGGSLTSNSPFDVAGPYWEPVKKYLFEPLAESAGI